MCQVTRSTKPVRFQDLGQFLPDEKELGIIEAPVTLCHRIQPHIDSICYSVRQILRAILEELKRKR